MRPRFLVAGLAGLLATAGTAHPVAAQSDQHDIDLIVAAGRPLRVSLDERIRLEKVGQPVTGVVTEPVYAYDRIVIAPGTRVHGHIVQIDGGSKFVRARSYLGGNFSPPKHAVLQFDTLLLDDGQAMPIDTVVKGGIPNVTRKVAGSSSSRPRGEQTAANDDATAPTLATRARSEIRQRTVDAIAGAKQKVSDTVASIKSIREPGQMARLKDAAVQQLPYHPQYLAKGTVYDAELSSPISFGRVVPAVAAPAGTAPTAS